MAEEEPSAIEVPEDEGNLIDESETDDTVSPQRYDITRACLTDPIAAGSAG